MLLAIDPGRDTGWALFDPHQGLIACGVGEFEFAVDLALEPGARVFIEHPVIYPGGRTRNPQDIVKLAVNAGQHAGRFMAAGVPVRWVEPREWKGTIDGDACNMRVWARLMPAEQVVVDNAVREGRIVASKRHNMLDAIGIGLFALGRFKAGARL